jgi:hypothetical protein
MIADVFFFKVKLLQVAFRFGTIVSDWSEDFVNPRSLYATGLRNNLQSGKGDRKYLLSIF